MIPRAFRIRDFRSIIDTGVCPLSGDGITAIAGQNESGKTATLLALRDFDLEVGNLPLTKDYMPDGNLFAKPRVSVLFEIDADDIGSWLSPESSELPSEIRSHITNQGRIWVTRDLQSGTYIFDNEVAELWRINDVKTEDQHLVVTTPDESEETGGSQGNSALGDSEEVEPLTLGTFGEFLRPYWPVFVYFDTFQDTLPKEVELETIEKGSADTGQTPKTATKPLSISKSAPSTVNDFIAISNLDLNLVSNLAGDDKSLRNYLEKCSTAITGDFLNYWNQSSAGQSTVNIVVKHMRDSNGKLKRDSNGKLKLQFYVRDLTDQYPEQRSKGFLWFLSFYLRLAAWDKRINDNSPHRFVLIDEPGSYLHAKAQRDILDVLEARVKDHNQSFIYTTHSPYLLPASSSHRFRVIVKDGSKGTKILNRLTDPLLAEDKFADALTPFITSIGHDIKDIVPIVGENNLLVEGISDFMYIHTWARLYDPKLANVLHVFPGSNSYSLETLSSLLIGWGLRFAVLLDHDENGNNTKKRLLERFRLENRQIIQPDNGATIEDLFVQPSKTYLQFKIFPP